MGICKDCKHTVSWERSNCKNPDNWRCKGVIIKKNINYVTGKVEYIYEKCVNLNKDGNCSHFENRSKLKTRWWRRKEKTSGELSIVEENVEEGKLSLIK